MLCFEIENRPNINVILKHPLIKDEIPRLLDSQTFLDEFSHTLLSSFDVFTDYKRARQAADQERKLGEAYVPKNGLD